MLEIDLESSQRVAALALDIVGDKLKFESSSIYVNQEDDCLWRKYSIGLLTSGPKDPLMTEKCTEMHRDKVTGDIVLVFTFTFSTDGELQGDVPNALTNGIQSILLDTKRHANKRMKYSDETRAMDALLSIREELPSTAEPCWSQPSARRLHSDTYVGRPIGSTGDNSYPSAILELIRGLREHHADELEDAAEDGPEAAAPGSLSLSRHLGLTPLHEAAKCGDIDTVRDLLENRDDIVQEIDSNLGWTALHYAAWGGHAELVGVLIDEYGADIEAKDQFNRTPYDLAIESGRKKMFSVPEESREAVAGCLGTRPIAERPHPIVCQTTLQSFTNAQRR
jgi:hypothetical protein